MRKSIWNDITKEDVNKAIDLFLKASPEYPVPRNTYLLFDGHMLPAKHIRGMAYQVHYGQEIPKDNYSGGIETKRFFEKLGFSIKYFGELEESDEITVAESEKNNWINRSGTCN